MESEVSSFIETMYGRPAAKMIKYHYTNWNQTINDGNSDSNYMKDNYLFAEVSVLWAHQYGLTNRQIDRRTVRRTDRQTNRHT